MDNRGFWRHEPPLWKSLPPSLHAYDVEELKRWGERFSKRDFGQYESSAVIGRNLNGGHPSTNDQYFINEIEVSDVTNRHFENPSPPTLHVLHVNRATTYLSACSVFDRQSKSTNSILCLLLSWSVKILTTYFVLGVAIRCTNDGTLGCSVRPGTPVPISSATR